MQFLSDIGIRSAWREHVAAAINWRELRGSQVFDKIEFASICLDLFFGGSLYHKTKDSSFQCEGCPFAQNNELYSACEVHMGVIEAFLQALVGESLTVYRIVKDQVCEVVIDQ